MEIFIVLIMVPEQENNIFGFTTLYKSIDDYQLYRFYSVVINDLLSLVGYAGLNIYLAITGS